jgi:hypothetical protein
MAAATVMVACAAIAPAFADAPAAPAPPPPNIQYAGLFDGYYLYQFNNPKTAILPGRFYDFRHNTPTLALGELNVWHTAKPGGFGFKTTLGAGDIAVVNGGGNPTGEGRYQSLMQAYGTYAFASGSGAGIDFGKFYTPIGYEVTESNGNFNETHSVPFSFIPFYHFGVRAYTPSYQGLVLTGYIVKAIYNTGTVGVQDDNGQPAFVGNAIWTDPKGKWVIGESLALGKDKLNLEAFGTGNNNKITVSDTDVTYNVSAKQIVGLNYTYAKSDPDNNAGQFNSTDTGWAGYYKQTLTAKTDFALRYSGGEFKSDDPAFMKVKPWEATATYEMHPTSTFTERLEYQHSGSNVPSFAPEDAFTEPLKKNQDTLEVAGILTFG